MKKIFITLITVLIFCVELSAHSIHYQLSMSKPYTHYFEVEMTINDINENDIKVKLPVWAPGSYLVREFAKSVEGFEATSNNKKLDVQKVNKHTWKIKNVKNKKVTVNYLVYAYELSVRTSFLDASHGYVNGTSMFMYTDQSKDKKSTLKIIPYSKFKKVATSLKSNGSWSFEANNYDELVDSPIEIGNHLEFEFNAAGTLHKVAMYGEGNFDVPTLKKDMTKIVNECTKVFGENPNKEYTFIIHNLTRGSGGLEHSSSTTLQVNRWTYQGKDYQGFLGLVAHEYFHLWNVKRIRPITLGPFDYEKENYTTLMWVMEGFTKYYDMYLPYKAGVYSADDFVNKLFGSINYIENAAGNKVQPVAHASFDAWIKYYRPTENSGNTTISYYSKGAIMASLINAMIVKESKGKKDLDDLMQYLFKAFYKEKNRGFTDEEFKVSVEKFTGQNMDGFFAKYIDGTETPDYNNYYNTFGLNVTKKQNNTLSLGASLSGSRITNVKRGTSAYEGGLNVEDEILAINGYRVKSTGDIKKHINRHKKGDKIEVLVSRDNLIKTLEVILIEDKSTRFSIELDNSTDTQQLINRKKWLGI